MKKMVSMVTFLGMIATFLVVDSASAQTTGINRKNPYYRLLSQKVDLDPAKFANQNKFTQSGATADVKLVINRIFPRAFALPVATQNCAMIPPRIQFTTSAALVGENAIQLHVFTPSMTVDPITNTPISSQIYTAAAFTVHYNQMPVQLGPSHYRFSDQTRGMIFVNTANNNLSTSDHLTYNAALGQWQTPFGRRSWLTLVTHELGHLLGLDHSAVASDVMNPTTAMAMGIDVVLNTQAGLSATPYPSIQELSYVNQNFAQVPQGCL